jgi:hypothetical protein
MVLPDLGWRSVHERSESMWGELGMNELHENKIAQRLLDAEDSLRKSFELSGSGVKHSASKGRIREVGLVHGFLSSWMPPTIAVVHDGEVFDSENTVSSQCDVLFADPSFPAWTDLLGYSTIPIELVHGVLEVKSHLRPRDLKDQVEKCRRLKMMKKSAYTDRDAQAPPPQTLFSIFSYKAVGLQSLKESLEELSRGVPTEQQIDCIFALDQGAIMPCSDNGAPSLGAANSASRIALNDEHPILMMTMVLYNSFLRRGPVPFNLTGYLDGVTLGSG